MTPLDFHINTLSIVMLVLPLTTEACLNKIGYTREREHNDVSPASTACYGPKYRDKGVTA